MITPKSGDKEQDKQAAEENFEFGMQAYHDSELEQAAQSFSEAERSFDLAGDLKGAGDSRAMIADILRQNGLLEQSVSSYRRAIQLYREAGCPSDEAASLLALGHVARQLGKLDHALEA